jgi:HEAT repeat protein
MARPAALLLLLLLTAGCGKKPGPAPPPEVAVEPPSSGPAEQNRPTERDKLLADLKSNKAEKRRDAVDAIGPYVEMDEGTRDALLDLLRDKTTDGPGKTHPTRITSTREAAAIALLRAGPNGETALTQKGLIALREGLSDKDPAVREHTAHVIGLIGPPAKSLANPLLRLASEDKDPQVRAIAFDSLRTVGITDVPSLAAMLNAKDPDVKRRAAELISIQPEVPPFAVPSLCRALDDEDEVIRVSAAMALVAAAPKDASKEAVASLLTVIKARFPAMFDPMTARPDDPQFIYFTALAKQGQLGVPAAIELLKHKNQLVRYLALQTLAEIGPIAKEAAPQIHDLFTDPDVALEAIVTLAKVGGDGLEDGLRQLEYGLASTKPEIVVAAIDGVTRLGAPAKKMGPEVLKQLESPVPPIRFAAVGYVATLAAPEAAKQAPALGKLASDPEPAIRRRVANVLEKLGPAAAPAAEAVGQALLKESDEATREQFVDALVAMGPAAKPAVIGLAPLLSQGSTPIPLRIKVIGALITADPAAKETAAALVIAAADRDPAVKRTAAAAIGKLNPLPDDARNALVKLTKPDQPGNVQMAALRGLATAGKRAAAAKPDLEAAAKSQIPGTALWANVALAAVDGDVGKSSATVREALTGRNGAARVAAADALTLLGPTAADVPALIKLSREKTPGAQEAAARALGLAGTKDSVPRLIELLNEPDADVRLAAAESLGKIGPPAAIPAIPKLKDAMRSNPALVGVCTKALEKLGARTDSPAPK